jgi:hypothetical protein
MIYLEIPIELASMLDELHPPPLITALELDMSPHLAALRGPRVRKIGKVSGFRNDGALVTSRDLMASISRESGQVIDEPSPWRSRILIGSIIGSEVGVLLALLTSLSQSESDPRKFAFRLAILFFALLGLSLLRRKALPAESKG